MRGLPAAADTPARQLAFSPAAHWLLLLTAAGRLAQLWLRADSDEVAAEDLGWADGRQAEDGEEREDSEDAGRPLDLLTVSADGQRAALADRSGGVLVWDLEQAAVTAQLPRHRPHIPPRQPSPPDSRVRRPLSDEYDSETARVTGWSRWAARLVAPVAAARAPRVGQRLRLAGDPSRRQRPVLAGRRRGGAGCREEAGQDHQGPAEGD